MTDPAAPRTSSDDHLKAATIAVEKNLITPEQLEECVVIAHQVSSAGLKKDVYDVLVEKGYVSRKVLNAIFVSIGKAVASIGSYDILSKLGEGGMGAVYKVRHKTNGRILALKTLKRELARDTSYLDRFMRETRNTLALAHPNIIRAVDMGVDKETHYYVMEYIEGESIEDLLKKRKRLTEEEAARIVIPVAEALAFANSRGIIHRDIKPANILISTTGVVKLCDMGIAKTVGTDMTLTQTGMAVGSPHYISPDQVAGLKDLDIRSDIYSLGATLYVMVTGKLPFNDENPHTLVAKRLTEDPPHPATHVPELSPEMGTLIMRMMARDRKFRIRVPEEVAERLRPIAQGIKSAPKELPPQARTARRPARKQTVQRPAPTKNMLPLALAAAGMLVAGAIVLVLLPGRKEQDKSLVTTDPNDNPAAKAQEWLRKAKASFKAKDYAESAAFATNALKCDPSLIEASGLKTEADKEEAGVLLARAVAKHKDGDRTGAIDDAMRALSLDSSRKNEIADFLSIVNKSQPK